MSSNNTFDKFNISDIANKDYSPKKSKKKKKCIIISIIVAIIIIGAVIGIIVAVKNKKNKKSSISYPDEKPEEPEEEEEPIFIDIKYTQDELKFFNIEKNITSTIKEEGDNQKDQNNTLYYVCTMGIRDKIDKGNINETYYSGFFAILSISQYNQTTGEIDLVKDNIELVDIINKKEDNELLNDIQKSFLSRNQLSKKEEIEEEEEILDEIEEELVKPFLKFEFYQNGSYRNIYRPKDLSQNNFDEMKEILDIIIPKISNETFKTMEEKRKESLKNKIVNLLENKDKKIFKIKRKLSQLEKDGKNGEEINGTNTTDFYYIESDSFQDTSMLENEEELKTNKKKPTKANIANNETQFNTSQDSAVYSDYTKFRGSNITKNVSTILDSNNTIKEIVYKSYMKLNKQEYAKRSDNETYNSDNYLEERNVLGNESEINVTDPNKTAINETFEENINSTEINYNLNDAESLYSLVEGHIIVNCTYYNRELIKDIYDNYLDKYNYENENNITLKMLRSFQNIMPIKDLDKYEIVEISESKRKLEEEENKYYYGLKKSSYRKNVFQTDFLGLDIALGITNTYVPRSGKSSIYFKLDLGDLKISHEIKSLRTNQPIIIENIQQMSFKLLQMMYLTHQNIQEKNKIYHQKISSIIKKLLDNTNLNIEVLNKFTKKEDYYSLITNNNETFKNQYLYLSNNITEINKDLINITIFDSLKENIKNYFDNYTNNITGGMNIRIEEMKKIIIEIREELQNNTELIEPYLLEDINSIIEQTESYLNEDYNKILKKQLDEEKIINNAETKEKIKEIINLNQLNNLEDIIKSNKIFDSLSNKEENDFILSNLSNIKQNILYNITNLINSLNDELNIPFENMNIDSNISSFLPLSEINNISNNTQLNSTKDDINEYFSYLDKIDESINDIVIKNIKNYANISFNGTQIANNMINNMTLIFSKKMIEIGKNIKNYLNDVKNNKTKMLKDFHSEYFENNIYKFYDITNQKNEYIINEDAKDLSHFENDFINSVKNIIIFIGKQTIDSNLNLAYQYLNEANSYVEDCFNTCKKNRKSFWGFFGNLFRDCDCEYYINIDLINTLNDMSENSYEEVLETLVSFGFIHIVEEYFYSFENEFKNLSFLIDNEIFNSSDFYYLKSLEKTIDFNFTLIKDFIINDPLIYLDEYGKNKSNNFLKDLDKFVQNKKRTVSNKDYDIKLEDYYFSSSKIKCPHRNNYLKIDNGNSTIINNLKSDKENISINYFNKLTQYNDFYQKYYHNLNSSFDKIINNNDFIIDLYFMLEKYYFEIKQYLDNIINDNFIQSLIDDFGNKIISNSLPDQTEYLKEIIDNFSIIYSNKTNIINEDIEYLTEKIEFLEYINYTKEVSINSYIQFIKSLLDNQIEIIYDLNENILNYIISNEVIIKIKQLILIEL